MGSERANEDILYNMGAKNTKKYGPINYQIIMAGESILMMNFRLCTENQILTVWSNT
jgi:bisphosphoglycerate-independent phosphoglycerate mutase (AlkP superfamily)